MNHNGYNYRTLNPWEQIALEHLSTIIGEIIGAGFENPNHLVERVGDIVLELSYWNTDPQPDTQQPKYIPYGVSGEDGDQEENPAGVSGEDGDQEENPAGASEENGDQEINPAWKPEEDPEQDLSLEREYDDIPY